jgi:hypothetical protein
MLAANNEFFAEGSLVSTLVLAILICHNNVMAYPEFGPDMEAASAEALRDVLRAAKDWLKKEIPPVLDDPATQVLGRWGGRLLIDYNGTGPSHPFVVDGTVLRLLLPTQADTLGVPIDRYVTCDYRPFHYTQDDIGTIRPVMEGCRFTIEQDEDSRLKSIEFSVDLTGWREGRPFARGEKIEHPKESPFPPGSDPEKNEDRMAASWETHSALGLGIVSVLECAALQSVADNFGQIRDMQ